MKHPITAAAISLICLANMGAVAAPEPAPLSPLQAMQNLGRGEQLAMLCFGKGEELSGSTKICYYDCGGSAAAVTVGAGSLCPLSIEN